MRTQGIGVIFPPGVRQSYSHSQAVPLSPGVVKAVRSSGRSENQHGSLILLAAEVREGWGSGSGDLTALPGLKALSGPTCRAP